MEREIQEAKRLGKTVRLIEVDFSEDEIKYNYEVIDGKGNEKGWGLL